MSILFFRASDFVGLKDEEYMRMGIFKDDDKVCYDYRPSGLTTRLLFEWIRVFFFRRLCEVQYTVFAEHNIIIWNDLDSQL